MHCFGGSAWSLATEIWEVSGVPPAPSVSAQFQQLADQGGVQFNKKKTTHASLTDAIDASVHSGVADGASERKRCFRLKGSHG